MSDQKTLSQNQPAEFRVIGGTEYRGTKEALDSFEAGYKRTVGCSLAERDEEEEKRIMQSFFEGQKIMRAERDAAVKLALPAMDRLAKVLCCRSGQPYKLRAILFSMYNGKPTKLEIVNFDWEIRKDLAAVCLAFGADGFFYDQMKAAIFNVGQWNWFVEEGGNDDQAT